jgi:UDP-N-acetylmuramate dehydrogenase
MVFHPEYSLTDMNTFHVRAGTALYAEASSVEELTEAVACSKENSLPILVLGGGSNILFTRDFEGLTIKIGIMGSEIVREDADLVWIRFGAGEEWHNAVMYCVDTGYGGIENLSLIPGTVGAAPMQNIGAYGVELREVFHSLEAFEISSGNLRTFDLQECDFGYRSSVFKHKYKGKYIIVAVTLRLRKKPVFNTSYHALQIALQELDVKTLSLRSISDAVIAVRKSKLPDPRELGNAGSFFKNPSVPLEEFETLKSTHPELPGYPAGPDKVKISSAWLIEQCGWKGKRFNNTGVHEKHALILVNYGNATGREIKELSENIQESVCERFGIRLEPEVNMV